MRNRVSISAEIRFWSYLDSVEPEECWIPSIVPASHGYTMISMGRRSGARLLTHRFAYELLVEKLPEDFNVVIDHLCRNRACVNPNHFEVVSRGENARRGLLKNSFICGHSYTDDNIYIRPNGHRYCQECHRRRARENHKRRVVLQ